MSNNDGILDLDEYLPSKCFWDEELTCMYGECDDCDNQPAPEDKVNGKEDPVALEWEEDPMGRGMGFPRCPACGEMPYSTERCLFCGQRFIQDERTAEYNAPAKEEQRDCVVCGVKGTLRGTRAKSNGHFHGVCVVCGCRIME